MRRLMVLMLAMAGVFSVFAEQNLQAENAVNEQYQLVLANSYTAPDLSIEAAKAFYETFKGDPVSELVANVKSEEAYAWFIKGEFNAAFEKAKNALAFAKRNAFYRAEARALTVIGNYFYVYSAYDFALENYINAENIYIKEQDDQGLINIVNNIGNVLLDTGNTKDAMAYYQRLIDLAQKINDVNAIGHGYHGIGNVYNETGEFVQAIDYLLKAKEYYLNVDAALDSFLLYGAISSSYYMQNRPDLALEWSEKRLALLRKNVGIRWSSVEAYRWHADILLKLERVEEARQHLDFAESLSPDAEASTKGLLNVSRLALFEKEGDFEHSLAYAKKYIDYIKDRYSKDAASRVSVMEAAFQSERKQREIEALMAENKIKQLEVEQQKYLWLLTLGIVITAIVAAVLLFYRWRANVLLNEQRQLNQKLTELDRLKDRILANTSHELRTPLNGIVGLSELLLSSSLTRDDKEHVQMIADCGRRLATVVDDLLNFAAIKEQSMEDKSVPFQLSDIMKGVMMVTSAAYVRDGLSVENQLPDKLPLVFAEPHRVQQILTNLLSNALKFTEKGLIRIDAQIIGGFVRVRVSDTGIGIAKDKLPSVFDAFTQVDNSDTRGYHGVGLGLTIVKELVQRFGGEAGVESQPNVGSVFWFTLPIYNWHHEKKTNLLSVDKRQPELA